MKAGAVARSSGSWMSTALGSDVYMGANEPVNSCGQICLLPTGDGPGNFTHDSQWPWLRYPATLTRSSFANHISTKAFYVTLAAAHMRLNRSKRHGTGELSVPSQMGH